MEGSKTAVHRQPRVRILSIETTGVAGSLALLEEDRIVAAARLPGDLRSVRSLAPAIQSLLSDCAWPVGSLSLIAVVQGPGSFTGLRVGITTAKTMAYAIGSDVIGIDTLELLAAQAGCAGGTIHAIVDAQRGQLCTASFRWPEGTLFPVRQTLASITDLSPWLSTLQPADVVIGPNIPKLAPHLPDFIAAANIRDCEPQASIAGHLAWRDYQAGRRDSLWTLTPQYHRASAAEEKRAIQSHTLPNA